MRFFPGANLVLKHAGRVCLAGMLFLSACAPPAVRLSALTGTPQDYVGQVSPTLVSSNTLESTPTTISSSTPRAEPAAVTATVPEPNTTDIPSPTAAPSPTGTPSSTPTLTQTLTASSTPQLSDPSATKTRRPTRTPTATPKPRIPLARVLINKPGHLSKLISPIILDSALIPSPGGTARVELIGEDGRLMLRNLIEYGGGQDYRLPLDLQLEYTLPGLAETARLQVIIQDYRDEIVYVSSVDVILLSIGETERNQPGDNLEPFYLQRPWSLQLIQGGVMLVSGLLRPPNQQPVIFELYSATGELAGSKQLAPEEVVNGAHYPFQFELPYTITKEGWGRLVVRQAGERIPGDAFLNSVQVYLKP